MQRTSNEVQIIPLKKHYMNNSKFTTNAIIYLQKQNICIIHTSSVLIFILISTHSFYEILINIIKVSKI